MDYPRSETNIVTISLRFLSEIVPTDRAMRFFLKVKSFAG